MTTEIDYDTVRSLMRPGESYSECLHRLNAEARQRSIDFFVEPLLTLLEPDEIRHLRLHLTKEREKLLSTCGSGAMKSPYFYAAVQQLHADGVFALVGLRIGASVEEVQDWFPKQGQRVTRTIRMFPASRMAA